MSHGLRTLDPARWIWRSGVGSSGVVARRSEDRQPVKRLAKRSRTLASRRSLDVRLADVVSMLHRDRASAAAVTHLGTDHDDLHNRSSRWEQLSDSGELSEDVLGVDVHLKLADGAHFLRRGKRGEIGRINAQIVVARLSENNDEDSSGPDFVRRRRGVLVPAELSCTRG